MKNLLIIVVIALSSLLLLTGCKREETPETSLQPIETSAPALPDTDQETAKQPEATNVPAADGPPAAEMVKSRITNEWVPEEIANRRPIAIMVPNTKTASQYGLSSADILYECNVESSITRLMGIWENWDNMEKVGNVRSSRDYFMYWSFEWDAFHVHYGGPFYMDDLLARKDTDSVNLNVDVSKTYHFRDTAKNDFDNAFTSSSLIKKYIENAHYSLDYRDDYTDEQHFLFSSVSEPNTLDQYENAIDALTVDLSVAYPLTNCYFVYNTETGLYDRYQHLSGEPEGPHMDLTNNTQLSFKNLLIQNTYYEVRDEKGYLSFQCHDTTRDGWFFTNGKGIHINWEKTSDYGATRYYDDSGNEIRLNTGKTMICIIEDGDTFQVDNKAIVNS